MSFWKRAICLLLVLVSITGHSQHVDIDTSEYSTEFGEKYGQKYERVTFYNNEEQDLDPFFGFDHGPNHGEVDGSELNDTDIVNLDLLYDKGDGGGKVGSPGTGGQAVDSGKLAGAKKDSDKTEAEKFNEFLVHTQRDLVRETLEFDSKMSDTLTATDESFSSQLNLTVDKDFDSQNANKEYSILMSTGSSYFDAKSENLNNLTKLEKKPYKSDQKEKLNGVRKDILANKPRSPQQRNAKAAGLLSLEYSDMAYVEGQKSKGDFYYEAAKQFVSIVADFNPVTSVAKDVYGLIVGKDFFTGDELSPFERSLCGAFALAQITASLYTAGMGSSFVAAGIKQIRNITKAHANSVRLSIKLAKIAKVVPHRVKIALKGYKKSVVLIGRDMTQVRAMRDELAKENIIVKIFDETEVDSVAYAAWENAKAAAQALDKRIPDSDIVKMDIFKNNKDWIEKMIKEGHTILDAGNPAGLEFSVFYEMEKIIIERMKKAGAQ